VRGKFQICWSGTSSSVNDEDDYTCFVCGFLFNHRCVYETLPKSADMYSICPFHWTHDSCRLNVYSKFNNCACKEGVMHVYPARPGDCHLMHLNAQKYWKSRDDICVNLVQNMTWTSTNLAANLFLSK